MLPFAPEASLEAAFARLRELRAAGSSGSLIRLGDGEGNLLACDGENFVGPMNRTAKLMFGRKLAIDELERIKADMGAAIASCDVLGVHEGAELDRMNRARLALGRYLDPAHMPMLTGANIHIVMSRNGELADLLKGEARVGLISCNPLGTRLQERLGIGTVDWYDIPSEAVRPMGRTHGGSEASDFSHFPRRYEELRATLEVPVPGMIFLVGAGVLAKAYCGWIKERGGLAIDAGSILDGWADQPTRRYILADEDRYRLRPA